MIVDKTGTLTQNKMSIAHLWFNNRFVEADTSEIIGLDEENKTFNKLDVGFKAVARVARLCSRAQFKPMQGDVPIFRREVNGDASESAILRFMETQFPNVKKYRSRHKILCEIPFNSRTKYQVFVHEILGKNQPVHFVGIKGAPEEILKLCNRILIGEQEHEMTEQWKSKVEMALNAMGSLGERVIGFADSHLPVEKFNESYLYSPEKPEFLNGLRFVGLMSMIDPPRAAVPDAIRKCRNAGLKIVMVTGDHPSTALAIGRTVGIISEGNETLQEICDRKRLPKSKISPVQVNVIVVTGSELKRMGLIELENILKSNKDLIFARTTPEQKYMLVESFQNLGNFVAVVGDGVNDSPALKKADVGISLTGAEKISKELSDIIIHDNFSSIVDGIQEGRRCFENLKKILAYSMVDNVAEMYCFCACVVLSCPLPLGTMAILLTVLGTDLLPMFSLMHEPCETDVMKLRPRNPKKHKLITTQLLTHTYMVAAVVEAVAGYFSYFMTMSSNGFMPWTLIGIRNKWENKTINDLPDTLGQEWTYLARKRLERYAQTAFFVAIVILQIANLVICKTRRQSIFKKKMTNWTLNLAIVVTLGVTCTIIYVPFLSSFFGMAALRWTDWLLPLPFAGFLLIYDEMRRFYLRRCEVEYLESYGTYHKMLSF